MSMLPLFVIVGLDPTIQTSLPPLDSRLCGNDSLGV